MGTDTSDLTNLSREECLRLLRAHPVHVGRVGLNDVDGQPLVLPVNYRLDGEAIVFRTEPGSLLDQQAGGHRVAFEVDEVDPAWEDGWSVLVKGTVERITDEAEQDRLDDLGLRPWAPGDRTVYLRVPADMITGRRIT
jgi:uncharacterized protein